ncbi:hypothetical protein VPNG_00871 [Cytospora leucostoma]|uniref:Peroxin 11C n=1 Tax=Cytospora leucostoma TaxID=1230097 RepID=A0A423XN14_9PEZI|nr:hypothetical protein VPNG_00871 [Cytospora leucostoma]
MTETTSVPETALTPTSDLPAGEPISTPTNPADAKAVAKSQPSPPSPKTSLTTLLKTIPSNTDAFLSHLQRCLATPSGIDTLLLFICYVSRLTGATLTRLSQTLLRRSAREIVALVLTLPPKTTVIFETIPDKKTVPAAARLAALLGQRLKNLGGLASEARTIARLWSLVGMYFWAKRLAADLLAPREETPPPEEKGAAGGSTRLAALVDWAQLMSCAAFQVLENGAYLSGRGVLGWTPAQQSRASAVGSRWLCVYTGLELGKLLAGLAARGRRGAGDVVGAEGRDEVSALRRSLAINLAWAPLTVNWSLEQGFLSDLAIGAGGCIPGVLQMRKLWRDTA